jgi:c-di-GMP-binding flagellar brake protein YcgR
MVDELEKRKFQRLDCALDITIEIASAQAVPKGVSRMRVQSRNISRGGICLETKSIELDGANLMSGRPFARENHLHLSMELIPGEPLFTATGEARWYDIVRDTPESICRLGVAFIEIKQDGKDQLERFLKKQHKQRR